MSNFLKVNNIIDIFILKNVKFRIKKEHSREVLIQHFILKKCAAESYRILPEAYGEHAIPQNICEHWFKCFKIADLDVKDK